MSVTDDYPPPPDGMTAQMVAYCHGVIIGSYHDAYRAAYNPVGDYCLSGDIWALNRHPLVSRYVLQLQCHSAKKLSVSREWLLEWWFARMVYNPAEITAWAIKCCRYCHGDGHDYQWREGEYFEAITKAEITKSPMPDCSGGFGFNGEKPPRSDCPRCDGKGVGRSDFTDTRQLSAAARAGFEGIKETRNGIEIKMADKDKAAEQFAKLSGWDVAQVRILTADVPEDAELAAMAGDPIALANLYKRLMTGGSIATH